MRKPNILFLSYVFYPAVGGIEINSELLAIHFHRFGYPVKLVTDTRTEGSKTFPFTVTRNPRLATLFKLHKWADVVFENNPSLRLSWPGLFFASKSVIAIRTRINRPDGNRGIQDYLKDLTLKNADRVIAVSNAIRESYFPEAVVIGNPYRDDVFINLNTDRKPLSFVFLGRLVSQKGVDIAIEAFVKIDQRFSDNKVSATMKIIGDGPEMDRLKQMVKQNNIEERISFEGRKVGSKLVEMLNSCRYIVLPSDWEAFGNVALEGLACGCLPFVSDSGGLTDAVGEAGVKFKSGSVDSLVEAIVRVIQNPKIEAAYRRERDAHLQEHLPERVAEKYLDVIINAFQKNNSTNPSK